MKRPLSFLVAAALLTAGCDDDSDGRPTDSSSPPPATMSFFVTSTRSSTGDLGGLSGADRRCQELGAAAGFGAKTWRAYLSVERDPANGNQPTQARDRIGNGPWFNANGVMVASNLDDLHARRGDADVFVDERNQKIAGQWNGSPRPVEHDILTGSTADGRLMPGLTCSDWTSASPNLAAQVGHSDGLGPGGSGAGSLSSWNSAHANESCANTAPRGGAGRLYCFASN